MHYVLRTSENQQIANAELPDNFAAERWAKTWVQQNGTLEEYRLEREDGNFAHRLFKTRAGQWYLTPQPAS
jgi:hypothetical protein